MPTEFERLPLEFNLSPGIRLVLGMEHRSYIIFFGDWCLDVSLQSLGKQDDACFRYKIFPLSSFSLNTTQAFLIRLLRLLSLK